MTLYCEHTNLTIPECSCPVCRRRIITENQPKEDT